MAAIETNFIAGHFTATYDGTTLGITDSGYTLEWQFSMEPITGDKYGDTVIDGIYRGGNCFLSAVFNQAELAEIKNAAWAWASEVEGALGTVGLLATGLAKALVLTDVDGLPSAGSPATLTASNAILAPGFNVSKLFGTSLRRVPLRFQLLPFGVTPTFFTQT